MTTKVVDSTVSQLLQDDSSMEYIDARKNPIASKDLPPEAVIKRSLIPEKQYRMCVANLFGFEARVIVTNPKDIKDPRSTWWCLADTGNAIGASRSGSLLGLLHRRERDSRIFTNAEIIFDDFKSKDTLPLANRGNTFVSLSGFLEILSKTELSSDKIDDFQEEIFVRVLPKLAFEGKAEVSDEYKEKIGMPQTQVQPTIYDYARALIAEKERSDALEAQNKALTAERDEAIRTKYHFVEGRDAKVCGELGGLRTQNEALRKQIGDAKTYKAVTAISWLPDYFDISNRGLYGSLAANLKKVEAGMSPDFAHTNIQDSRWGSVKAYHVAVIERLHDMVQADENLMKKYRKIASV